MGAKLSKRVPYKSQPKVFKLLNFLPSGPHKTTFGTFDIFKIEILTIFMGLFSLTSDPIGAKNSKRYSPYKLQPKLLKPLDLSCR